MTVSQVLTFACTVPPKTLPAAPQVFDLQLGVYQVDWVELEVPDGPNGDVGFYIAASGNQYLPRPAGSWIVTNSTLRHWDLAELPTSGDWQLVAYNVGAFAHTVQVYFGVEPVPLPYASATAATIPPSSIGP